MIKSKKTDILSDSESSIDSDILSDSDISSELNISINLKKKRY